MVRPLVRVSNITESEGGEPWKQIADRAILAAEKNQYMQNAPNFLVIQTDSGAKSGIYLPTAINYYNEQASQRGDPRLYNLNGIILLDMKLYPGGVIEEIIGKGGRNVIFRPTASATTPLKPCMLSTLENIRLWR